MDAQMEIINMIQDSLEDCVDLLTLITEQCDLNENVGIYLGTLCILKREIMQDIYHLKELSILD